MTMISVTRYKTAVELYASHLKREGGYVRLLSNSMTPTMRRDMILLISPCLPEEVRVGDVIVFQQGTDLMSHRVVKVTQEEKVILVKGDRYCYKCSVITWEQVIGRICGVYNDNGTARLIGWRWRALQVGFKIGIKTRLLGECNRNGIYRYNKKQIYGSDIIRRAFKILYLLILAFLVRGHK